jgi:hypothetical protein
VKEHRAGRDRQRIREERRDPGGRERSPALKAELERDERQPVTGKHGRDEG